MEEVILVAIVALHQFITAVFTLFNDVPTAHEKRMEKKRKRELTPYERNKSIRYGSPTTNLEAVPVLEQILADDNRGYMHKLTHLHVWQFFKENSLFRGFNDVSNPCMCTASQLDNEHGAVVLSS